MGEVMTTLLANEEDVAACVQANMDLEITATERKFGRQLHVDIANDWDSNLQSRYGPILPPTVSRQ